MLGVPTGIVMPRITDILYVGGVFISALSKNWVKLSLSTLVVMGIGVWITSRAQIRPLEVWQSIQNLGLRYALLAAAGVFGQVLFIVLRYQVVIPREVDPGFRRVAYAIGLGHMVNTYFPARAGDVLKCYLLSKGRGNPLTLLTSTGVLIADRLIDVGTLLAMAVVWKSYDHPMMRQLVSKISFNWGAGIGAGAAVATVAVGGLVWFFLLRKGRHRLVEWGGQFRQGMLCLVRPRYLVLSVVLAFISWSGELLAFQFLAQSQGVTLTFGNAIFVLLALNLAISVPLSFANVGPFEAAIALALTTFGMPSSNALAVATVHHGIQILVVALWGLLAVIIRPRKTSDPLHPSTSL
jgi:glycosyltransferase 2 family protein